MKLKTILMSSALLCIVCAAVWNRAYAQQQSTSYYILGLTYNQNQIVEIGLDGTIKRTATTGKDPHEVVISSDGLAYVANINEPSVSVVDLKEFKVVRQLTSPYFGTSIETTALPHGVDLSHDGNLL